MTETAARRMQQHGPTALLFLVALVLRLPGLNKGIWLDEYLSIEVAYADALVPALRGYDHPPLYFLLLRAWANLGGTEGFLRLLSVLFGFACVVAVYCWLRRHSRAAAWVGGSVFAAMPILLRYSQEIRHYGLLLLVVALVFLFADLAAERGSRWYWTGLAAALTLAVCTHLIAIFLLPPVLLHTALRHRACRDRLPRVGLVAVAVPPVAAFLFFYLYFLQNAQGGGGGWWMPALSAELLKDTGSEILGFTSLEAADAFLNNCVPSLNAEQVHVFAWILALAGALALMGDWGKYHTLLLAALLYWAELLVFSLVHTPVFWYRTALPGLVPFLAFVALQMGSMHVKVLRPLGWACIAVVCAAWIGHWSAVEAWQPKEKWRAAAEQIDAHRLEGDAFYFYPDYAQGPIGYYLPPLCVEGNCRGLSTAALTAAPLPAPPAGAHTFFVLRLDAYANQRIQDINACLKGLTERQGTPEYVYRDDMLHVFRFPANK